MNPSPDPARSLESLAPFAGLPSATTLSLAARCRPKTRRAGETLFLEGDPCRDLYILVTGW
jgi:CRP-like cAMP-binding protein